MIDDLVVVVRCRDADGIRKKNNEIFWKLTDVYEMGYEYECPVCGKHIDVRKKGKDLPEKCPYCETKTNNI